MPLSLELSEMFFERVPACTRQLYDIADGDPSMFPCKLQNLHRQFRYGGEHDAFSFYVAGEPFHLLLESA
jgi:hypothetical protein